MTHRWIYRFDQLDEAEATVDKDWDRVRGLLGGKGANLCDMNRLGVPVPPGYVITTEACNAAQPLHGALPDGLWSQVLDATSWLEEQTGRRFGDPANPLLVAVRSGAKFSMPGMMDTVLDVGLNDETVEAMIADTGDEHFVLDSYRRLIQMFGSVVLGIGDEPFEDALRRLREREHVETDAELEPQALRTLIGQFKALVGVHSAVPFPTDAYEQLRLSIHAVFASWGGKRAHDYRVAANIPHDLGTAVNVVTMVFGNRGEGSATGVAMSRNATTGEKGMEGDYLLDAQGEDVVAGIRPTKPIGELANDLPDAAAQFAEIAQKLESHYRDMQDMEFTVESGRLWLLQTRDGKRTAQAAVRIAVELVEEGVISRQEAVMRVTPDHVDAFLHPQFDHQALDAADVLTSGLNVSPGAAVGAVAFDADLAERWAKEGRDVILVRPDTKPDDVHGMLASNGILTSSGGRTSHAALVARQFGKPAVVGATEVDIDLISRVMHIGERVIAEGDFVSVDGTTGLVYLGTVQTAPADLDNPWLTKLLSWADEFRSLGVRANADDGVEAARARSYGAEGVGLARTEHMFFGDDRLPIMRRMITAPTSTERREAIDALRPLQHADFVSLFEAMTGLPVIIRLLDPPLHEFLPGHDELTRQTTDLRLRLVNASNLDQVDELVDELAAARAMQARVEDLREENPMLGLRGIRLGLMLPDLIRMQTRAIADAALDVAEQGLEVDAEIMIPLIGHVGEMAAAKAIVVRELEEVFEERGKRTPIQVGTMIEIPRAALVAGEIAEHAEFFSFGTNDLTQTTLGISRDDAEREFLLAYLGEGIIEENPFTSIDRGGVGRLMRIAVEEGRATRPDLKIGICGEHGGDPSSIALCHELGLDYVSCSAYRVPVARLAAAHEALREG